MADVETAVLYLEKNKLSFFDGNKLSKLDFNAELIRDFEIINEDLFTKTIFKFIDDSKFNAGKFLMVLGESAIFVAGSDEKNILYIPYNNVLSKKYQSREGESVIATNKDVVDVLTNCFLEKGFGRDEIVPAMIFGQIDLRSGLTMELAQFMIKNQNMATGKSMLDPIPILSQPVSEVFKVTKGKSTMLPMLLGVMGVMVLILVLLLAFRK